MGARSSGLPAVLESLWSRWITGKWGKDGKRTWGRCGREGGTPGFSAAALCQLEQKYVNILTSRTVI